ncbi:uncharacterized protein LOC124462088 [Drosophila willistoni]|uniref:uncharacterized protein LOC124462088 n=1 Tax=Drosophila willistoni TaxID=7260 RepID=UPI001F083337|nr:uncharacterized protein LOC124462088 [Drosophila willistoni]
MDWVAGNVCSMETYQATSLIDFLHLTPARVTWPKVEKCFQAIFELLEQQNADITTEKWAVVSRKDAAPIVTDICPNEQLEIWMDAESVDIIKERCNSLKFSILGSSGGSVQPSTIDCKRGIKRKAQGHEISIETKRIKYVLESSEESLENHSYGDMQEACDMRGCGIKSRPRPVKYEIEMEPDVINGQRPPCVNILPENRPFVVVISSSECEKNFCDLLEEFFGIFKDFRNVRCLDFNEVTPDTEYNGRLYNAAANEDTMDSVAGNVCSMETYQATSLIDFLHLTPARVTWPKVEKCFQAIFELLEQQNADITTEKWAVVSRKDAAP